jgi:two-component system response regulator YesN
VDDELLVRVGLRSLANWEEYGYHIAGEAADGEEALELIAALDPDLVLTDLAMPGMGGLELIERLRASNTRAGIIVLSCLNDFDSVRKAMREGAEDYVFKLTLKKTELLEVFERAVAKRLAERSPGQGQMRMVEASAMVKGSERVDHLFSALESPFRIIALTFVGSEPSVDLLRELKRHDESVLAFAVEAGSAFLAVSSVSRSSLAATFARAEAYAERYLGCPLLGAVSLPVLESGDVPARIAEAADALRHRCFGPGRVFAYAEDAEVSACDFSSEQYAEACMELSRAVDAADAPRAGAAVKAVALSLRLTMEEKRIRSLLTDAFVPFKLRARALGFDPDVVDGAEPLSAIVPRSRSTDEAALRMGRYADAFMAFATGKSRLRREIVDVRRWILADLARAFTVEAAAEIAGMSPSHFAHVFKEETGHSFIDFVNRCRMDRARELLLTTNLLIKEIADRLGFENSNYFCTLFRKVFGSTPHDVRSGHGNASCL